jgi:hypothetical protein
VLFQQIEANKQPLFVISYCADISKYLERKNQAIYIKWQNQNAL